MDTAEPLLRKIDSYLNEVAGSASDTVQVGPFRAFFRRDSLMPELSYARPTARLDDDARDGIRRVRAACAERGRACRWEFLPDLHPGFAEMLTAEGFPEPALRPLMAVEQEDFRAETLSSAEIRLLSPGETAPISAVLAEAFGFAEGEGDAADELAPMLARGSVACGAWVDGVPAAGGLHVPRGDTTELAGIGTRERFRRRGIAGALTSALAADAFHRGCRLVFLSAADENVQRVYARLGFRVIGSAMDTTL
ncbi:MAG TPA: GNAT family N-acetyltransferase [Armatimonadota bacterium]|jgi:ribosomal protein S18 acetylase RimI-like enzyme